MDTKGASMDLTPHLRGLVSEIHPAVENVSRRELSMSAEEFREHVTEENVRLGVRTILNESQALREMAQAQQFFVCGAVYDTFTGRVELVEDKASALISEGILQAPAVDQRPNGLQNRRT